MFNEIKIKEELTIIDSVESIIQIGYSFISITKINSKHYLTKHTHTYVDRHTKHIKHIQKRLTCDIISFSLSYKGIEFSSPINF